MSPLLENGLVVAAVGGAAAFIVLRILRGLGRRRGGKGTTARVRAAAEAGACSGCAARSDPGKPHGCPGCG